MTLASKRLIVTAACCLFLGGCAQTGPPLPPSLELPKAPVDLHASRKGSRVTLRWSEPTLTTDRQSVRYLGATLVCRSSEPEMEDCGNPAAILPAPASAPPKPTSSRHPVPLSYTDTLPTALEQLDPSAEVTYAVEVLNRNARGAALSNRVHVPAVVTLPPPRDLAATLNGDGVTLAWTSASPRMVPAASREPAALQFRYRIYRRDEMSGKDAIAGEIPAADSDSVRWTDTGFEWERTYLYRVTAVSIVAHATSDTQVEGDDSPSVRVVAHDVFPPAQPSGLQAAFSGEGQKPFIDLIWAPVTSADLAGYNVYRSAPGKAEVKLNSELVQSPAYRDNSTVAGTNYSYTVTAVDQRGNESPHSETASESVP